MEVTFQDIDSDELDESYVAVDEDELNSVIEKAEQADELSDRLDDLNNSFESLSERTEVLDDVDEDDLESLREHDDPVVTPREEYENKMDQVQEIGDIFAELLEDAGSPFDADELSERFSPLELKAKYEEQYVDDDGTIADQFSEHDPEPEGGNATPEELENGGGDDTDVDKEQAREALAREFESHGYDKQAEEVRDGEIPISEYEDQIGVSFDE